MTVSASTGVFSFAPQAYKSDHGSYAAPTNWYRHKVASAALGPVQDIQQFPPEVGGGYHPTGAYKRMAFGGGQAVMNPRLQNTIGFLLQAAVGSVSDIADQPESSMYRHIFRPPAATSTFPWLALRKEIPGATGSSDNVGEILHDSRVVGMRLGVAPGAIISSAFTFVSRIPKLSLTGVDSWSYQNTYEASEGVPLAHQGAVRLDGSEVKSTGLVLDLVNQYTSPDEELIIGSEYPDDFILRRQVLSATWAYKWQNPDLYQEILTGSNTESSGEIDWSPSVHTGSFEFDTYSPGNATGMSNPWRLRVYAPEMSWQASGPPVLVGDGWLQLQFVGVAQEQTSEDTFQIWLENLTASYTWS